MTEYIYATDDREGHWLTGEKIVRCRDCKWCMGYWQSVYCDKFQHALPDVEPNGYCAWAEPVETADPTCDECGMRCIEKYEAGCPREER